MNNDIRVRDRLIEEIMDNRRVRWDSTRSFSLVDILRDHTLFSPADQALLIAWDSDVSQGVLERAHEKARGLVEIWVDTNHYGAEILAERIAEAQLEMAEEES